MVALSSCEAEYIAACNGACQALWLKSLLEELKLKEEGGALTMMIDNQSAINLAKNPVAHGRSKHIETRFHFLRDCVSKEKLELKFCKTEAQLADVMTKALRGERFVCMRGELGMMSVEGLK